MKYRTGMALVAAMALVSTVWASADSTNQAPAQIRLEFDLVDGSRIIGVPDIASVPVQTAYAKMDIPLGQISTIEIGEKSDAAVLEMQNGDKISVALNLAPMVLETIFGQVAVDVQHVRRIHVRGGAVDMQGVVLHYSFDRDDGKNVPDRSEQGNTGTVCNSKWTPNGRFGGAYEFSGPEQYIGVDDHRSMELPAEMSVAAWVKIDRTGNGDVICAKGFGGGESWLLDGYGGRFRFVRRQNEGASYVEATSAQAVQPGVWTHVVGVADGERLRIYVNAVETIGQSYSGPFDTNDHKLSIGSRQSRQGGYDLHLVGTIDEFKVYNRPLSAREIKTMYESPSQGTGL